MAEDLTLKRHSAYNTEEIFIEKFIEASPSEYLENLKEMFLRYW